jgi:hypothetical protein
MSFIVGWLLQIQAGSAAGWVAWCRSFDIGQFVGRTLACTAQQVQCSAGSGCVMVRSEGMVRVIGVSQQISNRCSRRLCHAGTYTARPLITCTGSGTGTELVAVVCCCFAWGAWIVIAMACCSCGAHRQLQDGAATLLLAVFEDTMHHADYCRAAAFCFVLCCR